MISTIEPEEDYNNKTSQQRKRTLYCIGCDGTREAVYIVGKDNLPLCHYHWEVYAPLVLARRSVNEEEGLV